MANIESNVKTKRQSDKKNFYNKAYSNALKTQVKKSKKKEDAVDIYRMADSLAAKGIIHRNKAARIKSRNMRRLNNVQG